MDKSTIVRLIVMLLAWINAFTAGRGYELPHIDEATVSLGVAFVISLWTAWKDNDITQETISKKKASGLK